MAIISDATVMSKPDFHRRRCRSRQAGHDLAQIAVIHVQHAAPGTARGFQSGFRAPMQMIVDHRGQQSCAPT